MVFTEMVLKDGAYFNISTNIDCTVEYTDWFVIHGQGLVLSHTRLECKSFQASAMYGQLSVHV